MEEQKNVLSTFATRTDISLNDKAQEHPLLKLV
jgi:hypothetical protein